MSVAANSDVDPLGNGVGRTALINLSAGEIDLTWDAGIVVQMLGVQIEPTSTMAPTPDTTVESVAVETLPFTGLEIEDIAILTVGALAAGSVLLLLMGRREDAYDGEAVT